MQYQNDYIMRVIEQMGSLIRRALEMIRAGGAEEPYEFAEQAIGLALDLDPSVVAHLSPASLVSLLELNNLDDRVVALVAEALDVEALALESSGELIGAVLRRDQAVAVRSMLDPSRAN